MSSHLGDLQTGLRAAACRPAGSLRGVDVLTEEHMGGSRAGTASLEPPGWCGSACPAVSFAFLCFHHPLPLGQKAFILARPIVPKAHHQSLFDEGWHGHQSLLNSVT